jgi:hypothetical protein
VHVPSKLAAGRAVPLYDNSVGFDVPEVAWDMFTRQRLP